MLNKILFKLFKIYIQKTWSVNVWNNRDLEQLRLCVSKKDAETEIIKLKTANPERKFTYSSAIIITNVLQHTPPIIKKSYPDLVIPPESKELN